MEQSMHLEIALGPYSCPFRPWNPQDGRVFDSLFAYDAETTRIDDDRPYVTPSLVLATACDGQQGFYIPRVLVRGFFEAHADAGLIAHNASFDLRVTQAVIGGHLDLYWKVEQGLAWDTMLLERLHSLATAGHTARNSCSLDDCVRRYFGVTLAKVITDDEGRDVRTGFGQFLGRPLAEVPEVYLRYAAGDTLATWHLFWELNRLIKGVLQGADGVWGYVNNQWLQGSIRRFGPLTHHVQLRASILADVLNANGIGVDAGRAGAKLAAVQAIMEDARERMRVRGLLVDQKGSDKALQSILMQLERQNPCLELARSASCEKYSTAEEDLAALAAEDEFFADYARYRAAEKLVSTYLTKMEGMRIHPRFGTLLETGRMCCSRFTLQCLPKEADVSDPATTIRGSLVPAEGNVLIDVDYGQIELVAFGYVAEHQFGVPSELARRINGGEDIHRTIAATVLGRAPSDITKPERDGAKPVSFGRPGGMGAARLQLIARNNYGIELTLEEVEGRIVAYHRLCPELDTHLEDEFDTGLALARALRLTPAAYSQAIGREYDLSDPTNLEPQGWLGWMVLKVLKEAQPRTQGGQGRPYAPEEFGFFWEAAQELAAVVKLKKRLLRQLVARQAGVALWQAVRNWAGRRSVFTITGRLRANATFCGSRNCVFQGAAADGAILGLWLVWRAGHKIVSFVHDQIVVETPADDCVPDRVAEIENLMKRGMLEILPGMLVKVETVVTRSLHKWDRDPRYLVVPARLASPADSPQTYPQLVTPGVFDHE
jgi:DNA polymerase I